MKHFSLIAGLLLLVAPAFGQQDSQTDPASVHGLISMCDSTEEWQKAFCSGYILGTIHSTDALEQAKLEQWTWHVPDSLTVKQTTEAVIAFLKAHPEESSWRSPSGIISACMHIWPRLKTKAEAKQ